MDPIRSDHVLKKKQQLNVSLVLQLYSGAIKYKTGGLKCILDSELS